MQIQCKKCGHVETTNLGLFVKIIGGAAPVGGFWAWTAYLFAGTGFALPIVVAIITGGVGMLVFKEQIVVWITNKGYQCPTCSATNWRPLLASVSPGHVTAPQPSTLSQFRPQPQVQPQPQPQPQTQPRTDKPSSSGIGTLRLLIIVGGLLWLANIIFNRPSQAPDALPTNKAEAQIPALVAKPPPEPVRHHSPRRKRSARPSSTADVRECLSLKTNEAIAKCSERAR